MHLVALPLLLGPSRAIYFMGLLWVRGTLGLLRVVAGLSYQVKGLGDLPSKPVIIASKHQSMWETLAFCEIFNRPSFVLKRELLRIPFYGWYLRRMGMVSIDRGGGASAMRKMMADTKHRLASGKHVIIFPEGTRTKPGASGSYHPGVAALYKQLDVPVVPVALNSGCFWPGRSFRQRPGLITVSILPAIPPGLDRRSFMTQLEQSIEDESRKLLAVAGTEIAAPTPVDNSVDEAKSRKDVGPA